MLAFFRRKSLQRYCFFLTYANIRCIFSHFCPFSIIQHIFVRSFSIYLYCPVSIFQYIFVYICTVRLVYFSIYLYIFVRSVQYIFNIFGIYLVYIWYIFGIYLYCPVSIYIFLFIFFVCVFSSGLWLPVIKKRVISALLRRYQRVISALFLVRCSTFLPLFLTFVSRRELTDVFTICSMKYGKMTNTLVYIKKKLYLCSDFGNAEYVR